MFNWCSSGNETNSHVTKKGLFRILSITECRMVDFTVSIEAYVYSTGSVLKGQFSKASGRRICRAARKVGIIKCVSIADSKVKKVNL